MVVRILYFPNRLELSFLNVFALPKAKGRERKERKGRKADENRQTGR